jgi:glycosyltransferase involved in cell wall biosynthesis
MGYVTEDGRGFLGGSESLFFGLDFATDAVYRSVRQLFALRRSGTPIWFLVHDILPISDPQWFTYASRVKYRRWMRTCASLADGFICVSPQVADDLADLLRSRYGRAALPRIVTITPGSNISRIDQCVGAEQLPAARGLDARQFSRAVLVVGTLEPRKGHADALAAFDVIWRSGHALPLVLVGRAGWDTADLEEAIRTHENYGKLLFWFDDVSDEGLRAAYKYSCLTLVPSLAEGYGLPLDESLALGTPVLARDIPVFRRHDGDNIHYFPARSDARTLADRILALVDVKKDRDMPQLREWSVAAREVAMTLGCGR